MVPLIIHEIYIVDALINVSFGRNRRDVIIKVVKGWILVYDFNVSFPFPFFVQQRLLIYFFNHFLIAMIVPKIFVFIGKAG